MAKLLRITVFFSSFSCIFIGYNKPYYYQDNYTLYRFGAAWQEGAG